MKFYQKRFSDYKIEIKRKIKARKKRKKRKKEMREKEDRRKGWEGKMKGEDKRGQKK